MHWWDSSPRVLAGKDKNFDGTWMALSEKGNRSCYKCKRIYFIEYTKKSIENLASRGDW